MAALTAVNPKLVKGEPEIVKMYAPTGVAWSAGQFLTLNTSGLVAVADTAGGPAGTGLKYQALTARVSGDAAGWVDVSAVKSSHEYEMHVKSGTVAVANVGIIYGIDTTSEINTVDLSDTTDPCFKITHLGFEYDPAINNSADTVARVRVQVVQGAIDAVTA